MAAFIALLPTILNLLPSIIQFIEATHGSAPGQGQAKLAAAVSLVQTLVPEVAPHLTDDPAKQALLKESINLGVKIMNATGMIKAAMPTNPLAPAAS